MHIVEVLLALFLFAGSAASMWSLLPAPATESILLGIAGMLLLSLSIISNQRASLYRRVRPLVTVFLVFNLYGIAGKIGTASMYGTIDSQLQAIDHALVGFDPISFLQSELPRWSYEVLAIAYCFFIPYIHISLFLHLEARSGSDRDEFLTGLVVLYTCSLLGCLFLPAYGPAAFPARHNLLPLPAGPFVDLTAAGVASTGGLYGAFPSLHVGASAFLCLADRARDQLRFLIYVPLCLAIMVATLALRYHYLVDVICGASLAMIALPLGKQLSRRWQR